MGALKELWQVVPWGHFLIPASTEHSSSPPSPTPVRRSAPPRFANSSEHLTGARGIPLDKPGCTIADTCLTVHGYLEELAEGEGGYGVLRLGKERMDEAVRIAKAIGKSDLAKEMAQIAERLPEVHTAEAAEELAGEMRDVRKQAWRLGRACGLAHK